MLLLYSPLISATMKVGSDSINVFNLMLSLTYFDEGVKSLTPAITNCLSSSNQTRTRFPIFVIYVNIMLMDSGEYYTFEEASVIF